MIVPEQALPPPHIVRVLEQPVVQKAVPILVTGVAVYVLHKFASQVHWAHVKTDIAGSSKKALGIALLWPVVSFFALSFYDVLAMRSVAKEKVPDKIAGLAGASGNAISNLLELFYLKGRGARDMSFTDLGFELPEVRILGSLATAISSNNWNLSALTLFLPSCSFRSHRRFPVFLRSNILLRH